MVADRSFMDWQWDKHEVLVASPIEYLDTSAVDILTTSGRQVRVFLTVSASVRRRPNVYLDLAVPDSISTKPADSGPNRAGNVVDPFIFAITRLV